MNGIGVEEMAAIGRAPARGTKAGGRRGRLADFDSVEEADIAHLPDLVDAEAGRVVQLSLPGMAVEPASTLVVPSVLRLFDRAAELDPAPVNGRGASPTLRLANELVMATPYATEGDGEEAKEVRLLTLRDGRVHTMRFPLRRKDEDGVAAGRVADAERKWLRLAGASGHPWARDSIERMLYHEQRAHWRDQHWPAIRRALDNLLRLYVPIGDGRLGIPFVSMGVVALREDAPFVQVRVRIPEKAAIGPTVDRRWMRWCGLRSDTLYRIYLVLRYNLDRTARNGHTLTAPRRMPSGKTIDVGAFTLAQWTAACGLDASSAKARRTVLRGLRLLEAHAVARIEGCPGARNQWEAGAFKVYAGTKDSRVPEPPWGDRRTNER